MLYKLWLYFSVLFASASGLGKNQLGPKYLMGALGDSITAASFATSSARANDISYEVRGSEDWEGKKLPKWLPFLGKIENKETLSFASGVEVISLATRLGEYLARTEKASLTVLNTAIPNVRSNSIEAQVEVLEQAMKAGEYDELKLVTLLIGANDACRDTTNADFKNYLMTGLKSLSALAKKERIRVFVSSIPNIPTVGREDILNMRSSSGLKCSRLRDGILKLCNALTVWNSEAEYQEAKRKVVEKNQALEEVVREASLLYPTLDIFYSRRFFESEIKPYLLAGDCFHPNSKGHQMISDKFWSEQPWFRE